MSTILVQLWMEMMLADTAENPVYDKQALPMFPDQIMMYRYDYDRVLKCWNDMVWMDFHCEYVFGWKNLLYCEITDISYYQPN